MRELLKDLPQIVNGIFDILDLVVVRLTLLGLAGFGAYTFLRHHGLRRQRNQRRQ